MKNGAISTISFFSCYFLLFLLVNRIKYNFLLSSYSYIVVLVFLQRCFALFVDAFRLVFIKFRWKQHLILELKLFCSLNRTITILNRWVWKCNNFLWNLPIDCEYVLSNERHRYEIPKSRIEQAAEMNIPSIVFRSCSIFT